jgi:hypothetical protein
MVDEILLIDLGQIDLITRFAQGLRYFSMIKKIKGKASYGI